MKNKEKQKVIHLFSRTANITDPLTDPFGIRVHLVSKALATHLLLSPCLLTESAPRIVALHIFLTDSPEKSNVSLKIRNIDYESQVHDYFFILCLLLEANKLSCFKLI